MRSPLQGVHLPVVVVGAGQAGLSASWHLTRRGVPHVVLERYRVAYAWRRRWDGLRLGAPNRLCRLPGFPYAGPDPDGSMGRDELVAHLEAYARSFDPPLHEGVSVTWLSRTPGGPLSVTTTAGVLSADSVLVATGPSVLPVVPRLAERLPKGLVQVRALDYQAPEQLPPGAVLVVGSGRSGAPIAQELAAAGRTVHLSVGPAERTVRRYRGRDVADWLDDTWPDGPPAHLTGWDGGQDLDLRALAAGGVHLHGLLTDLVEGELRFRADLGASLDRADEVTDGVLGAIDKHIAERGLAAPVEPPYTPVWRPGEPPASLDLARSAVTSVVWALGARPDHTWVDLPVLTGRGVPGSVCGATREPGLWFLGASWGSARLSGVGAEAGQVVERVAG